MPDPAETDVPGEFQNEGLQALYDELVDRGDASLKDALQVGVDIKNVYSNLIQSAVEKSPRGRRSG